MSRFAFLLALTLWLGPNIAHAEGFSWLRSENRNVREGNQKLAAGDTKGALAAYDRAARELPSEGGVHLDRGIALMRSGDLPAAREALRLATRPPASANVRADAYYNLGTSFYKEADSRAGENKHDEAQKMFREAAEAFKSSMRLRPSDRNTAWNQELALRRIREQEEKQKQEDKNKQQDKQDKKQDGEQGDKQQDPQNKQDQQKQDQQKQDQAQKDQQKKDPQQQKQDQQNKDQQQDKQAQQKDQPEQPAVRPEVEHALDALQDGEENLERLRAMNRAARERRKPEKDW